MKQMPVRLSTTVNKIASLPNSSNEALMTDFYQYINNNGALESQRVGTEEELMYYHDKCKRSKIGLPVVGPTMYVTVTSAEAV
jgi:hypothetical protein